METWRSLLDPPVLFFVLGLLAVFTKSTLRIPPSISKFLALYLLMAIGFKGGVSLSSSGLTVEVVLAIVGGMALSVLVPFTTYLMLKSRVGIINAAAIGATYGSVSAVTFVAGITWLESRKMIFGGHMIAVLALMEFPAIITGVYLAKRFGSAQKSSASSSSTGGIKVGHLLHEALFNGSIFVLLGSLVVGFLAGAKGAQSLHIFIYDLFKGLLGFFLLDLGLAAGKQIKKLKKAGVSLLAFAVLAPLAHATVALMWAHFTQMQVGDGFLFLILAASASYIAVPAALKMTLPEAEPGLFLSLALGITFPFNIIVGLPLYWQLVNSVLSGTGS